MLRIAEHFHDSDLGRQRQGNEDNFYVRSPLFVVADGMGGAQAGEVASEMAVQQFEGGLPDGHDPAEALVSVIQQANARIHEQARADAHRAGMGTTVTAAYVAGDSVVVAHVGDSRAYLLREGDLIRLTRDHSLVGELVARGKLTEEQAEAHPQRSVITRALGPEPSVEVDVNVFPARTGDLFMVCSDGLTAMVPEPRLKPLLEQEDRSLEYIGRALIAAANEAGGRDNITVILFRLEDVEDRRETKTEPHEAVPTTEHPAVSDEQEAEYRRTGTVAMPVIRPDDPRLEAAAAPAREPPEPTTPLPEEEAPPRADEGPPPDEEAPGAAVAPPRAPRKRRRRFTGLTLVVLGLVLPLLIAGWLATRAVYFVGTDPDDGRTVAIFRGLPYELPFGIRLYERYYQSGVTLQDVPAARRAGFVDHELRSRDDAEDLVIRLEKGQLE